MTSFRTIEFSDPRFERDHLRHAVVKSAALHRRADITLFVPKAAECTVASLLILLHGVYGSHWSWAQRAGVHLTAQKLIDAQEIQPMVLAMPSDGLWGDGSGYIPHSVEDSEQWIVEEVPQVAKQAAACLVSEPKIFLAGLSMGGYGALRLGAKYSSRFAGISAHSAITHISQMQQFAEEPMGNYLQAVSEQELDPMYWMLKNKDNLPPLRFDCGRDDNLLPANRHMHQSLNSENIPHAFEEFPGGHGWTYWETHIIETLRFVDRNAIV